MIFHSRECQICGRTRKNHQINVANFFGKMKKIWQILLLLLLWGPLLGTKNVHIVALLSAKIHISANIANS